MVVRHIHFNPSSRAFTLCLHGSRIVLFATVFAVQIFGPKERATVVTLSVEGFIIVLFLVMGVRVKLLYSTNDEVDAPTENNPPLPGSQHDIEQGSGN